MVARSYSHNAEKPRGRYNNKAVGVNRLTSVHVKFYTAESSYGDGECMAEVGRLKLAAWWLQSMTGRQLESSNSNEGEQ